MPKYVITVRSVSGNTFGGALGATRYLIVPDGAAPAPNQSVPSRAWLAAVIAAFPKNAAGVIVGDALFLIHGFNVNSDAAVNWRDEVAVGLAQHGGGYAPTVISFDWPSEGKVFAYLPDLDTAAKTAVVLVNAAVRPLLRVAQTTNCLVRVNALAHSMGAFVLRAALGHADDGDLTGSDWMLGQLVMVSGDVEASSFVSGDKDTQSMMGHAYRLTNYFNRYDEALMISNAKRAGVEDRVGRVGLPQGAPASTVNVECSLRYDAIPNPYPLDPIKRAEFSHSWYFTDSNFYRDLAQTLQGAVDRNVIAKRTVESDGTLALATT
jgi:hypothetical protein